MIAIFKILLKTKENEIEKLKKREIQGKKLPEKFHLVKMMIFPIFVLQTLNIML